MAYRLAQYNQGNSQLIDAGLSPASDYMTLITQGTCRTQASDIDSGLSGSGAPATSLFDDDCVQVSSFKQEPYYIHVKIKRFLDSSQTFNIKLGTYGKTGVDRKTQLVKTVTVAQGLDTEWVDVEAVFTPLNINFDCIVFELVRTLEDYRDRPRRPLIVYQELSHIENAMTMINQDTKDGMIKIGIQAHPGSTFCINGEAISIGRSGQYEIRNGIITVTSFSAINPAEEYVGNGLTGQNGSNIILKDYLLEIAEKYNSELKSLQAVAGFEPVNHQSICLFSTRKKRKIDSFILDYMYEIIDKEDEGY